MAHFNKVVGELNLGDRRLSQYGYTTALKETAAVASAMDKGFLADIADPNQLASANAVTIEEVGLLNASLPVPMAFLSALTLGSSILVGFGKTGALAEPVFINQLYSFDGSAFTTLLTKSTDVIDGGTLLGVSVTEVGVLS